ncbi:unnamed protein product [Symbiodinium natans]|uniref:Uncharacterized protein n=1 Tax=Symbiodinium natans TaxID=878477 RepID=A0A812JMY3_9DINO|nr:unnamed protein product [Symbiodinium natans]CAE7407868.1 unnamed protein product [Symbiodinium natans]
MSDSENKNMDGSEAPRASLHQLGKRVRVRDATKATPEYLFVQNHLQELKARNFDSLPSPPRTPRVCEHEPRRKWEAAMATWRCQIRYLHKLFTTTEKVDTVLEVTHRRTLPEEETLQDYFAAVLCSLFELSMYSVYLTSCPAKLACLVVEGSEFRYEDEVKKKVLEECKLEWQTILDLETEANSNATLKRVSPHTRFRCYREPLTLLEQSNWTVSEAVTDMVLAWFPRLSHSANIESMFAAIEDNVKRTAKNNGASLPNLQCASIKALQTKVCAGPEGAEPVQLQPPDFEGQEIRNVKMNVFKPEAYTG